MRVVVTGAAGFIGRAIVERLVARGDEVVALVRDPARAEHLKDDRVTLSISDLSSRAAMTAQIRGADGLIHAAGSYRIGIKPSERDAMWDANVGATVRVLDAAEAAKVARSVYVSTVGVFGNTRAKIVDETYRRNPNDGFASWYDETKFRAHEEAEKRIHAGAPTVIVQPGQVYGPNDHSAASAQLAQAQAGRLRILAFPNSGLAWVHLDDLSAAIVAALDRGRIGEAYSLGGECCLLRDAIAVAARVGGHRPPRVTMPTRLLRLMAPINDRLGGLPGFPANLAEIIRSGDNVTYWAKHDNATAELGFQPRSLEQGIADTWGRRG